VDANLIYRNSGPGLLMRPDADSADVLKNIFDRNGDNVVISGSPTSSARSDSNSVHHNIVSNPERFNLTDGGNAMGSLNTFGSNCVFKPGDPANGMDNVTSPSPAPGKATVSGNTFANPQYVATRGPSAYRLQPGSPCATAAGAPVDFAPTAQDDARPSQVEAVNLRPNIVFIVTDDQRADTMHMTPHVMPQTLKWFRDGDAAAGIVGGTEYVNAFAPTPMCCPARASIFSGRYAHNHGVINNGLGGKLLSTGTVQRYLNDIGYQNAIFGKYLNGWKPPKTHDDAPDAGPAPNFHEYSIMEGYQAAYVNASPGMPPPGATEYTPDYVFDRAVDFVQGREGQADGKPWFLYVAPQAPHESAGEEQKYGPDAWKRMLENNRLGVNQNTPVPAFTQTVEGDDSLTKPRYVQVWGKQPPPMALDNKVVFESPGQPGLQKQMLRALIPVDDGVNRLFSKLEDTGEADDTLAVFMSDNGYQWREHAAIGGDCVDETGPPGRGTACGITGKGKPYVESVQIPFYVRWPGNPDVAANSTATKMVTILDPAATVMDVVDARPSGGADQPLMDGWSLFSYWQRSYILTEMLVGEGSRIPGFRALRSQSELYVRYLDDPITPEKDPGFQEYYDLANDPGEHRNLMGANGQRDPGEPSLGALPALLDIYAGCAGQLGAPEIGKYPCP
jgi:arylsulfatase A-like enzyme